MNSVIILISLIFLGIAWFAILKVKEYYILGYLRGFMDCSQKKLDFLETLPDNIKNKYGISIKR